MSTKNDRAVQAAIRKKIGDAAVIDAMLSVLRGEAQPLRSPVTGEVTGFTDPPSIELMMATADRLLSRISPQLRATDIETSGGGVQINVISSMPLPGSQARALAPPTAADEPVDTNLPNAQPIAHSTPAPAPAEAQPFQRRRRLT